MAKQLAADGNAETGKTESGNKNHNVKDLTKLIRDCSREMVDIKSQRQDLNEQAGEIRKRLREAGVETKAFEFAVRVAEMESEAKSNYCDWLKVCFEALGVGQQGSLFPEGEAPTPNGAAGSA